MIKPLSVLTLVTGVFAVTLGLARVPAAPVQVPTAADLANRIQAHYNTVRDFTADFTLSQTGRLSRVATTGRGSVKVKKPGRMRWTYTAPEKKEFVSDGTQIYSYFPADKYVDVTPMPKGNQVSTALLFLAGRGDLTRDFTSVLADQQPTDGWRLVLTPTTRETNFTTLTIEVVRTNYQWRGFTVQDDQGGSSAFQFTNLRENRSLTDREFTFVFPPGVEVRR